MSKPLVFASSVLLVALWVGVAVAERVRLVLRSHEVATDDGSAGEQGFVTAISQRLLAEERFDVVYTCGPEPMQRIVAAQAAEHGVYCEVSMERLMACGVGVCLSCTCETVHGLRRACVDGPVFDANAVFPPAA